MPFDSRPFGRGTIATVPADLTECRCCRPGFCPAHGTYTPHATDEEVASVLYHSTRHARSGRVIRKPLEQ